MTRVSFYLLSGSGAELRNHFACRLAEKAYQQGHQVYLHCTAAPQARELDDLLWTFRSSSFVPHALREGPTGCNVPVAIGYDSDPGTYHDILINLGLDIPDFFSRFERVAEIVTEDEPLRRAKRDSFRFYRDRGYPGEHHRIRP